jgi:hypothetical protein
MWYNLTNHWGFMRIIRLVIGGYALLEAYRSSDVMIGIMGVILAGMALLNMGCGAQGCGVPTPPRNSTNNTDEVEYEEIHSK